MLYELLCRAGQRVIGCCAAASLMGPVADLVLPNYASAVPADGLCKPTLTEGRSTSHSDCFGRAVIRHYYGSLRNMKTYPRRVFNRDPNPSGYCRLGGALRSAITTQYVLFSLGNPSIVPVLP